MTFLDMIKIQKNLGNDFQERVYRTDLFYESLYGDFLDKQSEAESTFLESGNVSLYIEETNGAASGFLEKSKAIIHNLIEAFKKFIKDTIESVRNFFGKKETKDKLDKIEDALNKNPKAKNKKVKIPNVDKNSKEYDKLQDELNANYAKYKSGSMSSEQYEKSIIELRERREKIKNVAIGVGTVAATLGAAFLIFKHHQKKVEEGAKESLETINKLEEDAKKQDEKILEAIENHPKVKELQETIRKQSQSLRTEEDDRLQKQREQKQREDKLKESIQKNAELKEEFRKQAQKEEELFKKAKENIRADQEEVERLQREIEAERKAKAADQARLNKETVTEAIRIQTDKMNNIRDEEKAINDIFTTALSEDMGSTPITLKDQFEDLAKREEEKEKFPLSDQAKGNLKELFKSDSEKEAAREEIGRRKALAKDAERKEELERDRERLERNKNKIKEILQRTDNRETWLKKLRDVENKIAKVNKEITTESTIDDLSNSSSGKINLRPSTLSNGEDIDSYLERVYNEFKVDSVYNEITESIENESRIDSLYESIDNTVAYKEFLQSMNDALL